MLGRPLYQPAPPGKMPSVQARSQNFLREGAAAAA